MGIALRVGRLVESNLFRARVNSKSQLTGYPTASGDRKMTHNVLLYSGIGSVTQHFIYMRHVFALRLLPTVSARTSRL